ncbi:hypothetical protein DES53_107148 [Roseimicrobium gellanilyticum]|uniref:Uncharacterized protein n=1 Tax=Roseimicrobium gellanilyticum TaxID=748857 RepID=A0A366HFK3_9BACT|nr:hypothetical protein DES53_107148 [Roseimicrobium gellanilyticum]
MWAERELNGLAVSWHSGGEKVYRLRATAIEVVLWSNLPVCIVAYLITRWGAAASAS